MMRTRMMRKRDESEDSLTYSNGVIEKIVARPPVRFRTFWA